MAADITHDSTQASHAVDAIYRAYRTYLQAHSHVVQCERIGEFTIAIELAVGPIADAAMSTTDQAAGRTCQPADHTATTKEAAAALDGLLVREVKAARGRFDDAASRADSALDGLTIGIPALTGLCALLALLGVLQRLREYR